ncbi:stage III sporulation protein AF [Clostridium sediminicola]|uniref:stage III sporulation protein AF n=1 Tax=Clostridium sediminicola TaxID=3114879 RepID=UPI0031F259BC
MDYLESWIISICTAVFFITAVEMILPKNSIKKYAKLTLGLILVTVILNPIIKLFDREYDLEVYSREASHYLNSNEEKTEFVEYREKSIENSIGVFADKLSNVCNKELKRIIPNCEFDIEINVDYSKELSEFVINWAKIGVSDSKIKKIKKVEINDSKEVNNMGQVNSEISNKIKKSLSQLLNISTEKIKVYKL